MKSEHLRKKINENIFKQNILTFTEVATLSSVIEINNLD